MGNVLEYTIHDNETIYFLLNFVITLVVWLNSSSVWIVISINWTKIQITSKILHICVGVGKWLWIVVFKKHNIIYTYITRLIFAHSSPFPNVYLSCITRLRPGKKINKYKITVIYMCILILAWLDYSQEYNRYRCTPHCELIRPRCKTACWGWNSTLYLWTWFILYSLNIFDIFKNNPWYFCKNRSINFWVYKKNIHFLNII